MNRHIRNGLLAVALLAFHLPSLAEDIDLYSFAPPAGADIPNVLLILDNAANFSAETELTCEYVDGTAPSLAGTAGGIEQCALYNVIDRLEVNDDGTAKIKIGMMGYNAKNMRDFSAENCGGTIGGCLMYPLVAMTDTNKEAMKDWIKSWRTSGGEGSGYMKANSEATAVSMWEAWAYYAGKIGPSGRDYAGVKPADSCSKNYIIFIGNAFNNAGTPGDSTNPSAKNALASAPNVTTALKQQIVNKIDFTPNKCGVGSFTTPAGNQHELGGFYADEWARYMNQIGTNTSSPGAAPVVTYTVGFVAAACKPDYIALMTNMKDAGGGKYFETSDYAGLTTAFETAFSEIKSSNSVFAAVSLPASANTQGSYLNSIYVGMFRPDANSLPRWTGNVKQYKLGLVSDELKLLDADDALAINANTGFITECARSFWTPTTANTYWALTPQGGCTQGGVNMDASDYPDGKIVEKGAQGYMLRSSDPATRNVKTCSPVFASCTTLTNFNTANTDITDALIGATTAPAQNGSDLIDWERGQNIADPVTGTTEFNLASTVMRPSVHGDVVHSRPVAINYGTDAAPKIVVFYGANDGMLRAVNGNRTASIQFTTGGPTFAAGSEIWSFIPPEFYGNVRRLRDNKPPIIYPDSTATGAIPKAYSIDGPVTAYQDASNAWIYATMRRGGRALYSFNVTSPASPTLKWKKGCPNASDDTGCTTGFTQIGQTWASPKIIKASGYGSGASPMLVIGGGYDTCEDADPNTCTSTKGNRIYIMDADTGGLLQTFITDRGVVGDVTVVPDANGLAKFIYAADMGGNIYRISGNNANTAIAAIAPGSWTITKVASLGCDTTASCGSNRKFMFAPDVVDDNGTYVLLIGSGDREKPLTNFTSAYAVTNYFFMVKDRPTDTTWLSSESGNCTGSSVMCLNSLLGITTSATPTQSDLAAHKGWYLGLASHEQVVTAAITVFNVVYFSTHTPQVYKAGECSAQLGTAKVYSIGYTDAASQNGTSDRFQTISGGGLVPSPIAGMVTLDNGDNVPFCIGCSPDSSLESETPASPTSTVQPKSRVYWYIQQ